MAEYKLMPNESVIKEDDSAEYYIANKKNSGTLVLTNFNIIFAFRRGMFGGAKEPIYVPLNQIIKNGNEPNISMRKLVGDSVAMDVHTVAGDLSFSFLDFSRKKTKDWFAEITKAITGSYPDGYSEPDNSILGQFKEIGESYKEEILSSFGLGGMTLKKKSTGSAKEKVTRKCNFCSAPIVGYKGISARCEYCDSDQIL